MDFSPRMKRILQLLLLQTDYLSEQAIADTLSISKRTVQRELDGADSLLAPYDLTLTRKKRAGLLLTGDEEKKAALRASLVTADAMDFTDKVKRRRYLLFELLRDRTPKKLFYYSELLGVSETTAASDLEALSPWLDRNHLSIVKKQGYGVVLNGTEKDYREAMRRFISEAAPTNVRTRDEISSTALAKAVMNVTDKGIYKLLNSQTLEEVYHILDTMDEPKLNKLTETAKVGLVIHIAIAIERIRQGSDAEAQTPPPMADDADTALARRIVAAMEEAFDLVMPEVEISYLLLHIKGAKVNYTKSEPLPAPIGEKTLLDTIDTMIDSFDPALAPQIHRDEEFIQGLFIHLQPTIVRIKNHLNIINPLLDDIKKEYTDVFDKSRRAAQVLEQVLGMPISDEEVGYLTIHFGAALERLKGTTEQTRTVIIGVVCASGFGLARLMLTRLQNKISQPCVLTAYGKKDLTPDVLTKTDFFVSTLTLSDIDADVVHSSPLISPSELCRIEGKINEYAHVRRQEEGEKTPAIKEAPTLAAFMDFMKKIKETATLAMDLVTTYQHITAPQNQPFFSVVQYVCRFMTGDTAKGMTLFEDIMAREKLHSQVFPEAGFALLHCRTKAVDQPIFNTCSPEKGAFTDPYFKGIDTILVMAMPEVNHTAVQRDLLGYISSSLIEDDDFYAAVKGHEKEKISAELRRILKTYIMEKLQ